ncbi:hypothetical protein SAMN05660830_00509 [Halodesulfovibrio aestuarii]|uniref:Uncharacterized protein n=1 Tax=Halodesulfovibrio aestuarii TaxID=126333 RepID=A0A8G2F817_9BACT|nr:hypothetical protein SAMN05660830_00509 [Halodesulfovibrio aestuarii]
MKIYDPFSFSGPSIRLLFLTCKSKKPSFYAFELRTKVAKRNGTQWLPSAPCSFGYLQDYTASTPCSHRILIPIPIRTIPPTNSA